MQIVFLMIASLERPAGRRYLPIARHLVHQGHHVRILALHPDFAGCDQRRCTIDGVEVWYVGQMHARKSGSTPQRLGIFRLFAVLVQSTLGMIWGILRSPADVYHLCKPQPVNGLSALIGVVLLRRRGFYVDCDDDEAASNRFQARWQQAVFTFWQWLLTRFAAGITVNTRFMAERIQQQNQGRSTAPIVYVPNGVESTPFQHPPAAIVTALRHTLGLSGKRVVAYVGTLALHGHPVDLLVAAFAQVARHTPAAVLLLIGGGEDLPQLRAQVHRCGIDDRVFFTGHLPHQSVKTYLSLADISVDPVYDNAVARARSPLKIFESMALGIPVVTGDVGDRAALLDYGRAGMLVQPGDVTALAQGITALLHDEPRRAVLAQASQRHMQRFLWRQLAQQWLNVYQPGNARADRQ